MTHDADGGLDRRETLKCMLWAGTGVMWTLAGGVPSSRLIGQAEAATSGFSFVQISDSHIGFAKPANPDARVTLDAAIDKIMGAPGKPAFIIHTGDISHTAKADQFDDAQQMIGRARLDVHYSPGEHDILDPKTRDAYLERFGKGAAGGGWYSFDQGGVHFVSLNNVVDLKKNGLGSLGADQLEWLEDDLKGKSASTPIVIFSPYPALDDRARMGLGHRGFGAGAGLPRPLRLGHRAQRPHSSVDAEGRGERRRSTPRARPPFRSPRRERRLRRAR